VLNICEDPKFYSRENIVRENCQNQRSNKDFLFVNSEGKTFTEDKLLLKLK